MKTKMHLLTVLFALILIHYNNSNSLKAQIILDTVIENIMDTHNVPGVAACAVKNGEVVWSGNFGYANISQNIVVSDSISFMLGSTSKTITGTAFMQLFEDGLIGLDDNINDYLPFQVNNPLYPQAIITPRMLLSHVSGIRDNWDILNTVHHPGGDSPIPLSVFTEGYLTPGGQYYAIENFNTSSPATVYEYTNVGSTLIAYLIEVITNISFEQYCQENIFVPLEMSETSWFLSNLTLSNVAMPYTFNNGNFYPFGHYGSPVYPCGFLRTSTLHLSKYLIAFMQKGQYNGVEILDSTSVELMSTLHYPDIAPEYGLQYQIFEELIGHTGSGPGVNSIMFFNPETNAGAIVMLNIENYTALEMIFSEVLQYAEEFITSTNCQLEGDHVSSIPTLDQNYPNPFLKSTEISFHIPNTDFITLKVYDMFGNEITTLVNGAKQKGEYSLTFDGDGLAEGIYFYRLQSNNFSDTKKMILRNSIK